MLSKIDKMINVFRPFQPDCGFLARIVSWIFHFCPKLITNSSRFTVQNIYIHTKLEMKTYKTRLQGNLTQKNDWLYKHKPINANVFVL